MMPNVPCKLRIVAPSIIAKPISPTNGQKATSQAETSTKEEPMLASGITRTAPSEPTSNCLVFQNLQSTDIAPRGKEEPSVTTRDPKQEPLLKNENHTRAPRGDLIIIPDDGEVVIPKKEENLLRSSGRTGCNEVIVLDSDDEAVHRPVIPASNAISRSAHSDDSETEVVRRRRKSKRVPSSRKEEASGGSALPGERAVPQDGGNQMKTSLEKFLRVISSSAKSEGSVASLLQSAHQTYQLADRKERRRNPRDSHPAGLPQRDGNEVQLERHSGPAHENVGKDGRAFQLPCDDAEPKRPTVSVQLSQREGPSSGEPRTVEKSPQAAFETDLPSAWFRDTSNDRDKEFNGPLGVTPGSGIDSRRESERQQRCSTENPPREKKHGMAPANGCSANRSAGAFDEQESHEVAQQSTPNVELRNLSISQRDTLHDEEEQMQAVFCRADAVAQKELPTISRRKKEKKRSAPLTPAPGPSYLAGKHFTQTNEKNRRTFWRKRYWRIDPKRDISGVGKRPGREDTHRNRREKGNAEVPVKAGKLNRRVTQDSDVDPDELDLDSRPRRKSTSSLIANMMEKKDRDIRAQRRAAEAEGGDVHWSMMVDRKPVMEENKKNVIVKVRELRGKTEYSFVKPRKERFRDLRRELELIAELPSGVQFELEYKNRVIEDNDTPQLLGIQHTARVRAKRKAKQDDDSSDSVTEVERKKQRLNLLKVTVQDENGKKHTFHHHKNTKFSSMFHAFARLCENDVRLYRFFYEGKRLRHEDRPADCEDFEDGSLIDAFFETTGGNAA